MGAPVRVVRAQPEEDAPRSSSSRPDDSSSARRSSRGTTGALEREEHLANLLRLRAALTAGFGLWLLTTVLDVLVARYSVPGALPWLLAMRGCGALLVLAVLGCLYLWPAMSPRALRVLEALLFTPLTVLIALMTLRFHGIASPYAHAIACVLIVRGVALPEHWKRNLVGLGVPALAYGLTQCALALAMPSVAAQFRNPALLSELGVHVLLHLAAAALLLAGGHTLWSLRRQVFEARQVGRYKLQRKLGAGSMGEVWLAWHPTLHREVALKLLQGTDPSPGAVARFEREIRATTELQHPHTVRVFDCGVTEQGQWFFAMEYLQGETLGSLVRREGPLGPARAVKLVGQAARALAEAHARGIVHRDVKPENLFVTQVAGEGEFLKVLDFGVARMAAEQGPAEPATLTHEGAIVGTPAYMPPEQSVGEGVDARSDVYSLGCVLYFVLAGRPPFVDPSATAVLVAHVTRTAESLRTAASQPLPDALIALVERCLRKGRDERYADATALSEALAALPAEPR